MHVLERIRDPQAIPPLVALLRNSTPPSQGLPGSALQPPQAEQTLQVAVVHALGQFPDERVVAPLLEMLVSTDALIYEGAINALSYLEDVALDGLIAALDVESAEDSANAAGRREIERKTTRVQRALLGMANFPGERLLSVLGEGSGAQAQQVTGVFLAKGAEAAQVREAPGDCHA